MKSRALGFFQTNDNSSPIEKVGKIIEGLISYNKNMAEQILRSSDEDMILLTLFSNFDIKKYLVSPELISKDNKTRFFSFCIEDVKKYTNIQSTIHERQNVDELYLHIYIEYKYMMTKLKETDFQNFRVLIFSIFDKKNAVSIFNRFKRDYLTYKIPLSGDILILKEALELLKNEVNPICLNLIDNLEVLIHGETTAYLKLKGVALGLYEIKSLVDANGKLFDTDIELKDLYNEHKTIMDSFSKIPEKTKTYEIAFLYYEKYLACNKIKDNIIKRLMELPESSLNKKEIVIPVVKKRKGVHSKTPKTQKVTSFSEDTPKIPLKECPKVSITHEIPMLIVEHDGLMCVETELLESLMNNIESEEEAYFYDNSIVYQKPVTKETKPAIPTNRCNLNKNQQNTLLEVFDELKNTSISLRDIMNLSKALGGIITTTGGNRCRMELKNIYAFLLMDHEMMHVESTQNHCQKATVTFHGGGHRAKPSQNHDKGTAPDYLVNQFRLAFERAGFTPKSLGLEASASKVDCNEFRL